MALRAECVIADGARNDLEEYFTLSFLDNDPAMSDATYSNFTITDYSYDLAIKRISVLPWSMSATVIATERVTLKARSMPTSSARIRTRTIFRCRSGRHGNIRLNSSTPMRAGISPN